MSSTACPSSSSPAVTIRATITTCRHRSYGGHDELTRSDTPAEPLISAVRGEASLVLQQLFQRRKSIQCLTLWGRPVAEQHPVSETVSGIISNSAGRGG